MANVLVVKAHPCDKEKSSTMAVLDSFLTHYHEAHPNDDIQVLDLYHENIPEIDGTLLEAWNTAEPSEEQKALLAQFDHYTEQFLNHDKIVIANPLWNLHVPVRLKMWLDTITVAQKTFKYTENGPVGLVNGKKVLHIQSSGSKFEGQDPASQYINSIFCFIGVDNVEHIYIDGKDMRDKEHADKLIKEATEKAERLSKEF